MEHVLLLGSGFAAMMALRRIDLKHYRVTVVSPRNHFLFTPLLPSTTVGTIEFRSIIEPIRTAREGVEFVQASCTSIDLEKRRATCRGVGTELEFEVEYDLLALAVGAWNNTYNIPGVREHAFFLKELGDARTIRERVIASLERADLPGQSKEERDRLLHFVVVGGGPTGVEFAAELHDLFDDELAEAYPHHISNVRVTLFEAGPKLLGGFGEDLRDYTARHFARQGIGVRLETPVAEVTERGLQLKGGEEVPSGLVVWSTGYAPTALAASLPFEHDRTGRLLVDEYLRLPGYENVYALGDCAVPRGGAVPQTAQAAMQQGKYLARALNRRARGKAVVPFRFNNLGMLAYIGDEKALADIPKVHGRWRGFLTWLFWRSAYLTRLVSLKNKVLVLFDWFKASVFGRDLSKF